MNNNTEKEIVIEYDGQSNTSFLERPRRAKTILGAKRAAKRLWCNELYCDGIVYVYINGEMFTGWDPSHPVNIIDSTQ